GEQGFVLIAAELERGGNTQLAAGESLRELLRHALGVDVAGEQAFGDQDTGLPLRVRQEHHTVAAGHGPGGWFEQAIESVGTGRAYPCLPLIASDPGCCRSWRRRLDQELRMTSGRRSVDADHAEQMQARRQGMCGAVTQPALSKSAAYNPAVQD